MRTYVIYHGNCHDGFGAAVAAWMRLGDGRGRGAVKYISALYGNPLPAMEEGSAVYILDFSYPRETIMGLAQYMERVVVLDHHATAQEALEGLRLEDLEGNDESRVVFDVKKSGAVLAWEYFHQGKPVPEFLLYLQDRDLWKFELRRSKEVAAALRSYPLEFEKWADFIISPEAVGRLRSMGEHCLRLISMQVDVMARQARWAVFDVASAQVHMAKPGEMVPREAHIHLAPVANATVFLSEVGERLLQWHPEARFAAYYMDRADGKRQWGLRSRAEPDPRAFDCSAVATAFGGGGHPQAAGFVTDLLGVHAQGQLTVAARPQP